MPDPPPVSLLTRYLLENPWPVGSILLALAVGLSWTALQTGRRERWRLAAGAAGLAAVVFSIASLVSTSGEHARRVVRAVVDAAVAGDVAAAGRHFTDDATLSYASVDNPGLPRSAIEQRLDQLDDRWRIESNSISRLRAHSVDADRAVVDLACRTTLAVGFGPTPTRWWFEVRREPDGAWRIDRLTWLSLAGRAPTASSGY